MIDHRPEPLPSTPPVATTQVPAERRTILRGLAAGAIGAAGAVLGGCRGSSGMTATTRPGPTDGRTLRIGYVSPSTGFAAGFGSVDRFVIDRFHQALRGGLTVGANSYQVRFELRDSQSDPQRAAQMATDLVASGVDMVLASSTPETVNPVADVCELAKVPCLTSVCPWESFFFGRGGTPAKPFTYTYHFFVGITELEQVYTSLWRYGVSNNKVVGPLWPDDTDGAAGRENLGPLLTKAGFTVVDPGGFPDGSQDYTAIIKRFKDADAQILTSFATPTDFATFWQQAAAQHYHPRIATIAKSGLLPAQIEALGRIGIGITTGIYWHPAWPTTSTVLGLTSQQLVQAYERDSGRQWTQNLGSTVSLFEAALMALSSASDPKDKPAVARVFPSLRVNTLVGTLDWTAGPVKNVALEPLVGGKWVKGSSGFPVDVAIVDNRGYPKLPLQAKDTPLSW